MPQGDIVRRHAALLGAQERISAEKNAGLIGATVEVLVEGPSRLAQRSDGPVKQLTGRSMTDHIVVFDGSERLVGHTVRVAVEDASPFTLYGRVLTGEVPGAELREAAPPQPRRVALPLA